MQLSRLEIRGFKSFGDKVVIHFGDGITGIVGPNGCGKSNVVDAIRWVLGEQRTKNLRSDKMENIIFNGSRSRKPLQMAEVALTFNNTKNLLPTEYSEVTISRRYYRSGESEYLLNGVQCRLKDINNLFLDTGIGSDSYAIIELKMIDDLLNDTSGSRRDLFEEAAGISKFKQRKKETLKKLSDTDTDLARVDDLLFEIEKNLKTLEKQARQAEKYFAAKQEYRKLSLSLARKTVNRQYELMQSLHAQVESEQVSRSAQVAAIAAEEAMLEQNRSDIVHKEKLLASRQKTLNEHVARIRHIENEKKLKNERTRYLNDRREALEKQISTEQQQASQLHERIAQLEIDIAQSGGQLAEAEQLLLELQSAKEARKEEVMLFQTSFRQLELSLQSGRDSVQQLSKTLEIKQIQYNNLRQELDKSHESSSTQRQQIAQLSDEQSMLKDEVSDKEAQLESMQQDEVRLQTDLATHQEAIDDAKEKLALLHRETDALQHEYDLTKSLVDSMEGFPEAVRFLHNDPHFPRKTPLFSDILTCDDAYKLAIENYLQPYMNHYVVASLAEAFGAIRLLSEAAKGRANFFLLDSFAQSGAGSQEPILTPGCISAMQVIEYDPAYHALLNHLLGKVYILDSGQELPPDSGQYTLITQDGKLIWQPHVVAGGSVGLFEGKRLGRAKNLEKMHRQLQALKASISNEEQNLAMHREQVQKLRDATRKEAIAVLQKEIDTLQRQYTTVRIKQEQMAELMNSQSLRAEDMQERMLDLKDEINEIEPALRDAREKMRQSEAEVAQSALQMRELTEALSSQNASYNEQHISVLQLRNRVESLRRECQYKQDDAKALADRLEKNQQEWAGVENEIRQMMESVESGDDRLLALYEERESIEAGVNQAERDYYHCRNASLEIEKNIKTLRHNREQTESLLSQLQQQLNESQLSMTSVRERLMVEFETDLNELLQEPDNELADWTEENLREEQRKTKERYERMGPVNSMAMEAYQEMKERYDFIDTQKNDLMQARGSLQSTIDELDAVARQQFTEAFEQIRQHFVRVFRSLFSEEDSCDLVLLDPFNPLESEIDIIARPKGKRPLTINQLSGGEKTLTATSLLFAIYLLRPAPFCIFDEVDAPLDDANIDKFNNIIKKFSDNSQFIIVTHNKRTMASTDVIYGVTMVEQGVSRVVPVDLRELSI